MLKLSSRDEPGARRAPGAPATGISGINRKGTGMGIKDMIEEKTGIYKLGFDPASFLGILLPLMFVVIVGGALAFMVLR
jgi:hypothetical protein